METLIKIELIENYIKKNKLNKKAFCKACKISLSTLNKILKNNFNFDATALFKIGKLINVQVCEMFDEK